jgi:hypothetical protein
LDNPIFLVGTIYQQRALRFDLLLSVPRNKNRVCYALGSLLVWHVIRVLLTRTFRKANGSQQKNYR